MPLKDNLGVLLNRLTNSTQSRSETSLDDLFLKLMNGSNFSHTDIEPFPSDSSHVENAILITAYLILMIISIFGNTLVCHVVFKNTRMHTVTNFFIVNLAVSDLIVTTLNVPFNLAKHIFDEWPFGEFVCHLVSFSQMVSVYVSTYTMTCIAFDRHQVILYPFSQRLTKFFAVVVIVYTWIVAIGFSLPYGIYNKVQEVNFVIVRLARCRQSFPSNTWEQYLTVVTLLLQYVIPLAVIAFAYGRIVHRLWMRTHLGAVTENQQISQAKAKRRSIKMLITVVVVFALCWMPLNLYHLLTDIHPDVNFFRYNSTVFFVCHWIAISSTCYNPFVYCWLNENFRKEAKSMFRCCFRRSQRVHPGIEVDGILLRSDRAVKRLKALVSCTTRTSVAGSLSRLSSVRRGDTFDREDSDLMTDGSTSSFLRNGGSRHLGSVPEEDLCDDDTKCDCIDFEATSTFNS